MRRIIALTAPLFLLLFFFGCGGDKSDVSDIKEGTSVEETETGEIPEEETGRAFADEPRIFRKAGKTYAPITATIEVNVEDEWSGVKEMKVSLDVSEYSDYDAPITFDSEGRHTIKCRASDNVGNLASLLTISMIIDDTPPETSYAISPEPVVVSETNYVPDDCTIRLSVRDNLSGVQKTLYNINGKDYVEYNGAIAMPGVGKHIFDFRSQDNVGSWEPKNALTLVVDGDGPITYIKPNSALFDRKGEIWNAASGSYYASSGVVKKDEKRIFVAIGTLYGISADDDRAGVKRLEVAVDGAGYREYKAPIVLKREGSHRISMRAIDMVGNVSKPFVFEVTVDDSPPKTRSELAPQPKVLDGILYVKPSCILALEADDTYSGVEAIIYNIDGGDTKTYKQPIPMPGPGVHLFAFEARDIVGNWEITQIVNIVVDGKAPVTELKPGGKVREHKGKKYAPVSNLYFLFSTDDYAGVADIRYAVDDSAFMRYRGAIKLSPGEHTITYFAVDRAGNEEKKRVFKVTVEESSYDITLSATEK